MKIHKSTILGCLGAASVDLLACAVTVFAASGPREGECDGGFYLCSFRDLLPAAGIRIAALIMTWIMASLATANWGASSVRACLGCVASHLRCFFMLP